MIEREGPIRLVMALRLNGITDTEILSSIERISREAFLSNVSEEHVWEDISHDFGHGLKLSRPFITTYLIQSLDLGSRHRVLQVPTGLGYQASVLSQLCRLVYTCDSNRTLRKEAEVRFKLLEINNIVSQVGSIEEGWPQQAPFDRILLNSGFDEAPQQLLDQLAPGGIFVAPLGPDSSMRSITRITRKDKIFEHESLMLLPPAMIN